MLRSFLVCWLVVYSGHAMAQSAEIYSLNFATRKYELDPSQKKFIDSVVKLIQPETLITISGFADQPGGDSLNNFISTQRAQNVKAYMLQGGIAAEKIIACEGKGAVKDINGNLDTNSSFRRVDINILPPTRTAKFIAKMKLGQTVVLKGIYFVDNSHQMLARSVEVLDNLYMALLENPNVKVRIEGHLNQKMAYNSVNGIEDAYDQDTKTYQLSNNRAKAIVDYLVNKGLSPDKLAYTGYGRTKALVLPEESVSDKMKNQRVEMRLVQRW